MSCHQTPWACQQTGRAALILFHVLLQVVEDKTFVSGLPDTAVAHRLDSSSGLKLAPPAASYGQHRARQGLAGVLPLDSMPAPSNCSHSAVQIVLHNLVLL